MVAVRHGTTHALIKTAWRKIETATRAVGEDVKITGIYAYPHRPLPMATLEDILHGGSRYLVVGAFNAVYPARSHALLTFPEELVVIIKQLPKGTAAGINDIHYCFIRNFSIKYKSAPFTIQ